MLTSIAVAGLEAIVTSHLGATFPAAQIEILWRGEPAYARASGYLDPDTQTQTANDQTRFDLASVSKLFVVTAFMTLVEQRRVALDQPVCEVLTEFTGARPIAPYPDPLQTGKFISLVSETDSAADASAVTFRHLLSHNSGLPAWLPLWKMP